MINKKHKIPCMIMRGGTSKGLFFLAKDLPKDTKEREKILLELMGSPDSRQIDGLGGATSVTSKVAVIQVSERSDADIDYTFYQVSIDKALVSSAGNCGNISAGVGPFALECGLVPLKEPVTKVKIFNTNTQKMIEAEICCENGGVKYDGDASIAGVPGTASPIKMKFLNPAGTLENRKLKENRVLPTGNVKDEFYLEQWGKIAVSIIDVANPLVFVKAEEIGLRGDELPSEINSNEKVLERLETIRSMAAVRLGLCQKLQEGALKTPGIPKMAIVAPPKEYQTSSAEKISRESISLLARMMSMQKTHPTYAMTGAMCTAAAAVIPGSVVADVVCGNEKDNGFSIIHIGHPGGIMDADVCYQKKNDGSIFIQSTSGIRTANLLMKGIAFC